MRTISRLGAEVRVGIGPSITVAVTASAQIEAPGGARIIAPDHAAAWLDTLPVEALHGIGPRQAAALRDYGVHSVGLLAAITPVRVQRLLGGRAGRTAATAPAASTPARRPPHAARLRHRPYSLSPPPWTAPKSAPPSSTP
ncbi:hypothetical protein AB0K68_18890 [Streptomyces sp. NPDC050698]